MIQPHLGPWKTGKSIFEFGFDFAEIFFFINKFENFVREIAESKF